VPLGWIRVNVKLGSNLWFLPSNKWILGDVNKNVFCTVCTIHLLLSDASNVLKKSLLLIRLYRYMCNQKGVLINIPDHCTEINIYEMKSYDLPLYSQWGSVIWFTWLFTMGKCHMIYLGIHNGCRHSLVYTDSCIHCHRPQIYNSHCSHMGLAHTTESLKNSTIFIQPINTCVCNCFKRTSLL
jgi:hypothetical protein